MSLDLTFLVNHNRNHPSRLSEHRRPFRRLPTIHNVLISILRPCLLPPSILHPRLFHLLRTTQDVLPLAIIRPCLPPSMLHRGLFHILCTTQKVLLLAIICPCLPPPMLHRRLFNLLRITQNALLFAIIRPSPPPCIRVQCRLSRSLRLSTRPNVLRLPPRNRRHLVISSNRIAASSNQMFPLFLYSGCLSSNLLIS
jgi:hypothetical protein